MFMKVWENKIVVRLRRKIDSCCWCSVARTGLGATRLSGSRLTQVISCLYLTGCRYCALLSAVVLGRPVGRQSSLACITSQVRRNKDCILHWEGETATGMQFSLELDNPRESDLGRNLRTRQQKRWKHIGKHSC